MRIMTAEKENKVYTITEEQKATYLAEGFDIRDDEGNIIAYGAGKTVTYEDYMKLMKENEELRAKIAELEIREEESVVESAAETPVKAASKKKAVE